MFAFQFEALNPRMQSSALDELHEHSTALDLQQLSFTLAVGLSCVSGLLASRAAESTHGTAAPQSPRSYLIKSGAAVFPEARNRRRLSCPRSYPLDEVRENALITTRDDIF